MDLCAYTIFRSCIYNPEKYLRTLGTMVFDDSTLGCNEHFAECVGVIFGCRYLVYAPLDLDAIHYANRAVELLSPADEDLGTLKIINNEVVQSSYFSGNCSLILEILPQGVSLCEALYTHSYGHLMQGLRDLKQRLARHNLCHTNLTPENIIVADDHTWHPIRLYYIVEGYRKQLKALKHLTERIKECSIPDTYTPTLNIFHIQGGIDYPGKILPLCERRRRVITQRGTGFYDENDRLVIEDIYRSATDFKGNRAVVTLKSGKVGVINRNGRYIIPPEYDEISYDVANGEFSALSGVMLTRFDYLGEEILP